MLKTAPWADCTVHNTQYTVQCNTVHSTVREALQVQDKRQPTSTESEKDCKPQLKTVVQENTYKFKKNTCCNDILKTLVQ